MPWGSRKPSTHPDCNSKRVKKKWVHDQQLSEDSWLLGGIPPPKARGRTKVKGKDLTKEDWAKIELVWKSAGGVQELASSLLTRLDNMEEDEMVAAVDDCIKAIMALVDARCKEKSKPWKNWRMLRVKAIIRGAKSSGRPILNDAENDEVRLLVRRDLQNVSGRKRSQLAKGMKDASCCSHSKQQLSGRPPGSAAVFLDEAGKPLKGKKLVEHAKPIMQNFGRVSDQLPDMELLDHLLNEYVPRPQADSTPLPSPAEVFTWEFFNKSIGHTRKKTAPGPDGMPAFVLARAPESARRLLFR
eukprot:gene4993-5110_t